MIYVKLQFVNNVAIFWVQDEQREREMYVEAKASLGVDHPQQRGKQIRFGSILAPFYLLLYVCFLWAVKAVRLLRHKKLIYFKFKKLHIIKDRKKNCTDTDRSLLWISDNNGAWCSLGGSWGGSTE